MGGSNTRASTSNCCATLTTDLRGLIYNDYAIALLLQPADGFEGYSPAAQSGFKHLVAWRAATTYTACAPRPQEAHLGQCRQWRAEMRPGGGCHGRPPRRPEFSWSAACPTASASLLRLIGWLR